MQTSMNAPPIMEDASKTVATHWGRIIAVVMVVGDCQVIVETAKVRKADHGFVTSSMSLATFSFL